MTNSHASVPTVIKSSMIYKNSKITGVASSASWKNILDRTITPASSSSKFLIMASIEYEGTLTTDGVALFRDGSILASPTSPGSRVPIHRFGDKKSIIFTYVDSPATTSNVLYELKYYLVGSSLTLNGAAVTELILLEV